MVELSRREKVYLFRGVIATEDAEIGFKFLISLFSLTISLRVVHSGEADVIVEETS